MVCDSAKMVSIFYRGVSFSVFPKIAFPNDYRNNNKYIIITTIISGYGKLKTCQSFSNALLGTCRTFEMFFVFTLYRDDNIMRAPPLSCTSCAINEIIDIKR